MAEKSESNDGSSINMSTLIHVGIELVCASGLVYWVHSKHSALQQDIAELMKRNAEYETIIKQQQEIIMKHDQIIGQLYATMKGNVGSYPMPQQRRPQPMSQHSMPQQSMAPQQPSPRRPPPQSNPQTKPKRKPKRKNTSRINISTNMSRCPAA